MTEEYVEEFVGFALIFNFSRHQAVSISKCPLVRQWKDSKGTIYHEGNGLPGYGWKDYVDTPTS